ncbi:recombinase family protein [Actinomadura rubrisoli]|uniref:recombinase family protein n=1 Tax=Actinomadura rubrisoli TaxID=2530368 RepID=UPI003C7B65D0
MSPPEQSGCTDWSVQVETSRAAALAGCGLRRGRRRGHDAGIDTSTAVGRMFFQILGAIEFEHALMAERTLDGLEAARARGRTSGQKPKLGPRQVKLARHACTTPVALDNVQHTASELHKREERHSTQAWIPRERCRWPGPRAWGREGTCRPPWQSSRAIRRQASRVRRSPGRR